MTSATESIQSHPFRIDDPEEPGRCVRGVVEVRAGTAEGARLPYVMVLHGFKGFMDWGFFPELARRLAGRGFAAVRFNRSGSGVGESPLEITEDEAFEKNTPSREVEDTDRVRARIEAGELRWAKPGSGGIFGHSLGGATAILHAARHVGLRAMVLWAPSARFDRYEPALIDDWRRRGVLEIPNARTGQIHRLGYGWIEDVEAHREALDLPAACGRLTLPTLICHGAEDPTVPLAEGQRLARSFPDGVAQLVEIAGAGHTFGARHPLQGVPADLERALDETVNTFSEHLA